VWHLGGVVWSVWVSVGSVRVELSVVRDGQMGLVYGSITTHKPSHSRGFATLSIVSCWIILRSVGWVCVRKDGSIPHSPTQIFPTQPKHPNPLTQTSFRSNTCNVKIPSLVLLLMEMGRKCKMGGGGDRTEACHCHLQESCMSMPSGTWTCPRKTPATLYTRCRMQLYMHAHVRMCLHASMHRWMHS